MAVKDWMESINIPELVKTIFLIVFVTVVSRIAYVKRLTIIRLLQRSKKAALQAGGVRFEFEASTLEDPKDEEPGQPS